MSDKCEYTKVAVQDDDDEELLTPNSEDNMSFCSWIVSKWRCLVRKLRGWFRIRRTFEYSEAPYNYDSYQQETQKLKEELKNLALRHGDTEEKLDSERRENETLHQKLDETEKGLNDEREAKKTLQCILTDIEGRLDNEKREKEILHNKFEEEKREKEKALTRFEEERQEKEKALTRLSSIAGEKLRVNNPGIADLSDENRPNKLGEKFSELYDNEWTEVFESLEEPDLDEEEIIKQLLDILKDVYTCCQRFAKAQRERLIQIITLPSRSEEQLQDAAMPDKVMSKVVDLQKQTASIALSDLKNTIITTKSQFVDTKAKQTYTYRCMELCWMMAIQDPPMALDFGPAQDEDFDRNVFRLYTKQGNRVGFIVWPAIYLHDKGPLVQKGVLQPVPS